MSYLGEIVREPPVPGGQAGRGGRRAVDLEGVVGAVDVLEPHVIVAPIVEPVAGRIGGWGGKNREGFRDPVRA